jgi:ABC-type antimicrobial peptide transport system permease subunit
MVVKDIVRMAAFGTLGGVAGCLMLGRLVESQLYGVSATSPLIIAAAVGVIVLVALAAGAVPSRRAAGVDPTIALRNE